MNGCAISCKEPSATPKSAKCLPPSYHFVSCRRACLALQEFARIAETYGDGTTRLTCEENILFVNVPNDKLPAMLAEPIFQDKFKVNPGGWQWRD